MSSLSKVTGFSDLLSKKRNSDYKAILTATVGTTEDAKDVLWSSNSNNAVITIISNKNNILTNFYRHGKYHAYFIKAKKRGVFTPLRFRCGLSLSTLDIHTSQIGVFFLYRQKDRYA